MRIYTLQIHTTNQVEKPDSLYHFLEFDNLCREFEKQIARMEGSGTGLLEKTEPRRNGCGEVTGGFRKANPDGSLTIGRAYDYDILDDD